VFQKDFFIGFFNLSTVLYVGYYVGLKIQAKGKLRFWVIKDRKETSRI
jgi:hypothetical protein